MTLSRPWPFPDTNPSVPVYRSNPASADTATAFRQAPSAGIAMDEARARWRDFAPLLARIFPELGARGGLIESPLRPAPAGLFPGLAADRLFIKADNELPLTGTIKARGGVYEVLSHARRVALDEHIITSDADIANLASPIARATFARHRILTGSTGNLGYSVGLTARALGFAVEVHMSADAKPWKVKRLRDLGAGVVQHTGDFSVAVSAARAIAAARPGDYFIDDENSLTLFMGYAAAARELEAQLDVAGVKVSFETPLIVYLPCGVGGSPGGVTFGLKHIFGDLVHSIFAEPIAAPSVMLQVTHVPDEPVNAYEFGLDNRTIADGLAVPAASMLVVKHVRQMVDGFATVDDASLLYWARELWERGSCRLEPSAAAGFEALRLAAASPDRPSNFERAAHVVWTTGGAQLPDHEFNQNLELAETPQSVRDAATT